METTKTAVEQSQYLTFFVADEEYAVGILRVKEIIQYDTVTKVPKTPRWIRGVINLRGNVVPVIDLAVKFGLDETSATSSTCIVITEVELGGEQAVMGMLADSVSQVIELWPDDIQDPPTFGAGVRADYLLGMGKAGKKFVLLLDVDQVLSANELLATASLVVDASPSGDGAATPPGDEAPGNAAAGA